MIKKPIYSVILFMCFLLTTSILNCTQDKQVEICNNGIDDDEDSFIDCDDLDCSGTESCPVEICNNGIDDDGDTFTDCADGDCFDDPACD